MWLIDFAIRGKFENKRLIKPRPQKEEKCWQSTIIKAYHISYSQILNFTIKI